jgi:hypothetical protein
MMLVFSSFRTDIGCIAAAGFYAFSLYQEWITFENSKLLMVLIGLIAVASLAKHNKRSNRR